MAKPLTLDEVINKLMGLRRQCPDYSNRPVHMLDMEDDGNGLVTHIETDCFSEEQGPVTSLMSWPSKE